MLDHPLISQRYFFPRRQTIPKPFIVEVPGASLHCRKREGSPTLLHFHGNGEVVANWQDLGQDLHAEGFGSVLAEYRGYGGSSGEPALAGMLEDALAIYDAACDGPTVVYGRSVGSLYALHVAAHRPVKGLILESGIADVGQRLMLRLHPRELGGSEAAFEEEVRTHFDHRAKLRSVQCPLTVLHASHDDLVTPDHAEDMIEWAHEAGRTVRSVFFEEGDHNTIWTWNGPEIMEEITRALRT